MTNKEKLACAKLLRIASDCFSNHGCGDLDEEIINIFTHNEWVAINKRDHELNGDPEEHIEDLENNTLVLEDWIFMDYFADLLDEEIREGEDE